MESAASTELPDYADITGAQLAAPQRVLARLGITRTSA
jgi:hypothetical protein